MVASAIGMTSNPRAAKLSPSSVYPSAHLRFLVVLALMSATASSNAQARARRHVHRQGEEVRRTGITGEGRSVENSMNALSSLTRQALRRCYDALAPQS